jgi:hypothetical protein
MIGCTGQIGIKRLYFVQTNSQAKICKYFVIPPIDHMMCMYTTPYASYLTTILVHLIMAVVLICVLLDQMKTGREEPMPRVLAPITLSLCLTKRLVKLNVLRCSIDVDQREWMIDVFHSGGSVMERKIVKMATMKVISAQRENAHKVNFSVKITIAR